MKVPEQQPGNPDLHGYPGQRRLYERLMNGIENVSDSGCWLWGRSAGNSGYGKLSLGGRKNRRSFGAHRVAYEMLYGPVPAGLLVMHSCDNRLCVNPFHLSVGTHKDNSQDMARKGRNFSPSKGKTHCPRGHIYSGVNSRGARICRTCQNEATLAHYHRSKLRTH